MLVSAVLVCQSLWQSVYTAGACVVHRVPSRPSLRLLTATRGNAPLCGWPENAAGNDGLARMALVAQTTK